MARYFFNVIEKGKLVPDKEGTECQDDDEARDEAKASAKDLAIQAIKLGVSPDKICVEIQDSNGKLVGSITVGEAIDHPNSPRFHMSCGARDTSGDE